MCMYVFIYIYKVLCSYFTIYNNSKGKISTPLKSPLLFLDSLLDYIKGTKPTLFYPGGSVR